MAKQYLVTDTELKSVADKIRSKTGGTASIKFYSGFNTEIEKLTDTRDANATAGQILSGKTAYVNKQKVTGTIATKTSSNVTVSENEVTIPSGYYASQVKKTVGTKRTSSDVTVSGNVVSAPAGFYSSAVSKTVGTTKAAETFNVSTSDRTIASGKYLTGTQTIRGVAVTSTLKASNIKSGVVVKVGDSGDAGRIKNVTGTYTASIVKQQTTRSYPTSFTASSDYVFLTLYPPTGYSYSDEVSIDEINIGVNPGLIIIRAYVQTSSSSIGDKELVIYCNNTTTATIKVNVGIKYTYYKID